jgi:kinesin family protein 5
MGEENGQQCAIKVICRFRPLNGSENERGDQFLPKFPQDSESVSFCGKTYTFDKVFGSEVKQNEVYNAVASRLVDDVIKGRVLSDKQIYLYFQ